MFRNVKIKSIIFGIIIPLLLWLSASFFIGILIGIATMIIPMIMPGKEFVLEPDVIVTLGLSSIFTILVLVPYYIKYKKKYDIKDSEVKPNVMLYLVPISFGACLSMNVLLNMFDFVKNDTAAFEVSQAIQNSNPIIAFIVASIIAPFVEELIYRGFIYKTLEKNFGFLIASIISSLMFGIIHFNITQGIYAFVVGILLSYIYYKYNNLTYTYFMHLLMNFFSMFIVGALITETNTMRQYYLILIGIAMVVIGLIRLKMFERSKR